MGDNGPPAFMEDLQHKNLHASETELTKTQKYIIAKIGIIHDKVKNYATEHARHKQRTMGRKCRNQLASKMMRYQNRTEPACSVHICKSYLAMHGRLR